MALTPPPAQDPPLAALEPGADVTLGILAGGRATRLGGLDKAWLEREGIPQVVRCAASLAPGVAATVVSANRSLARYEGCGLRVIADPPERLGQGPVAALDALARTCATPWLLTVPVDLVNVPAGLLGALRRERSVDGAYACDADGAQPLVALWRLAALRAALDAAGPVATAVRDLHRRMAMACVRFDGVTFGNLNTPDDLAAAGVRMAP